MQSKEFLLYVFSCGKECNYCFPPSAVSVVKRMSVLMLLFTSLMCRRVFLKAAVPMAWLSSICACVKCSLTTGFQITLMV